MINDINIYIFSKTKEFIYIEYNFQALLFLTNNFKHINFYEELNSLYDIHKYSFFCIKFFPNKNIIYTESSTKSYDSIIEEKSKRFVLLKYDFALRFSIYKPIAKHKHKLYYNKTNYI